MLSALSVPDEIVIGFFSTVVVSLSAAVIVLWRKTTECDRERKRLAAQKKDESN